MAAPSQVNLRMMAQMVPSNDCGFKLFELEHGAAEQLHINEFIHLDFQPLDL